MANAAEKSVRPALAATFVASEEPPPEGAEPVSLAGRAVATPCRPPVTPAVVAASSGALLPRAVAAERNAWYVLLPVVGALIAPTMPEVPQCVSCLQWNQMGWVSVTLIVKVEANTRPESKPATELELLASAAKYVHGAANDDCVTEWGVDPPGK